MITVRDCVKEYLLAGVMNMVTGENGKTVQFQDIDSHHKVFGCYNEEGDWEKEVYDIEEALDYIGLGGERSEALQ